MPKTKDRMRTAHRWIARNYDESWKFRLACLLSAVGLNLLLTWLLGMVLGTSYWWPVASIVVMLAVAFVVAHLITPPFDYYEKGGWE